MASPRRTMYLDPSIKQTWDWGGIQNSQGVLALGVLAINLPGEEGDGCHL